MVYIYDILLNFNKEGRMYDFFEWEFSDNILHVKRVPLFKVNASVLRTISQNVFKANGEFLLKIKNLTEIYLNKKIEKIIYAALFTDGKKAVAVGFNDTGQSVFKSNLLLDEEDEVIDVATKMDIIDFPYSVERPIMNDHFITRSEEEVKKFLKREIDTSYKNSDISKLKYMYVEYFDDNKEDIHLIYRGLLSSLNAGINDKHNMIYNLLKMTYSKK